MTPMAQNGKNNSIRPHEMRLGILIDNSSNTLKKFIFSVVGEIKSGYHNPNFKWRISKANRNR